MSATPRHGRNLFWLFLAEGYQKGIALVLFVYVSYTLTAEENGWYATYVALWPALIAAINLGASDIVTREIAQHRAAAHRYIAAGWLLQCAAFLPALAVVFLIVRGLAYPQPLQVILLLVACSTFVTALARMNLAVFAAYEQFRFISAVVMVTRTFAVGGSLLLLYLGFGVASLVFYLGPVAAVQLIVNATIATKRFGPIVRSFSREDVAFLFRQGLPVSLSGIAATAYFACDMFLVIRYGAASSIGAYGFAIRFVLMLFTISDVLESVYYPVMSRTALDAVERKRFVATRCLKASLLLAIPFAAGGAVLAEPIAVLLGGEKFAGAAFALQGLLWVMLLDYASRALAVLLRAERLQRLPMLAYGTAAILKIALGPWAIIHYDIGGLIVLNLALSASVLVFEALAATWLLGRPFLRSAIIDSALRPALAAAVMSAVLLPLRSLPVLVLIPLGALVFLAVGWLVRAVDTQDQALLLGGQR